MTVIAAWPGTGKTTAGHLDNVVDLESSDFKWLDADPDRDKEAAKGTLRQINPTFPDNYVDAIVAAHQRGQVVLVSMHADVLDAIEARGVPVTAVVPGRDDEDIYLARYAERGNPPAMIEHMRAHWDTYLDQAMSRHQIWRIRPSEYLIDVLDDHGLIADVMH